MPARSDATGDVTRPQAPVRTASRAVDSRRALTSSCKVGRPGAVPAGHATIVTETAGDR